MKLLAHTSIHKILELFLKCGHKNGIYKDVEKYNITKGIFETNNKCKCDPKLSGRNYSLKISDLIWQFNSVTNASGAKMQKSIFRLSNHLTLPILANKKN